MLSYTIALAGGTGSGKGFFARRLSEKFPTQATIIPMDMYYKDESSLPLAERINTNVDNPEAFDFDQLLKDLLDLRKGQSVNQPIYDYEKRVRLNQTSKIEPKPLLIVEGLLALSDQRLNDLYDLKIYLEVDPDLRLARRLLRDLKDKRHETLHYSINQYLTSARPSHKIFVEPQKVKADIVIDWSDFNQPAFDQVVDIIQRELKPQTLSTN